MRALASLLPLAILLVPACQVSPGQAVADMKAIHEQGAEEGHLVHRERAELSVPPEAYTKEDARQREFRVGEMPEYELGDREGLELAIMDRISATPPSDLEASLEASGWLIVQLLHDDFRAARVKSAAILSQFAGWWIERNGVRLRAVPPTGDLAVAVEAYHQATLQVDLPDYVGHVAAALEQIDESAIDDPLIAARLLNGMAQRLRRAPVQVTGELVVQRTAVRAILAALEAGMADADPEVAQACRERHTVLMRHVKTR
ncbi:MAG TPA: hypothetical protein VGC54_02735 [Planctomycetota bacterium]